MKENYEETLKKYKPSFTVEEEARDIICLKLVPEKGKEEWCLWCDVIIDCSAGSITIYSDRGNYQLNKYYGARSSDNLEVLKMLCRFSEWYFLDQIAKRTEFDWDASHKKLEEFLLEYFNQDLKSEDEDVREEAQEHIDEVLEVSEENNSRISAYWYKAVEKALEDAEVIFDCETMSGLCVEDYPHYAKSIARVFVDDIQPAIQKIILQRHEQEWFDMVDELRERTAKGETNDSDKS